MIEFFQDVLKGFGSLHILARAIKIGPVNMPSLAKHTAKNISAFGAVSAMLVLSITLFSTSVDLGLSAALLSALIAFSFIGIVGFLVNLAIPSQGVFMDDDGVAERNANKWASFLAVNFLVQVMIYIIGNLITLAVTGQDRTWVAYMMIRGMSWGVATWFATVLCSVMATTFVFFTCFHARKIVDSRTSVACTYVFTNLICVSVFYILHFYLFNVGG